MELPLLTQEAESLTNVLFAAKSEPAVYHEINPLAKQWVVTPVFTITLLKT
jgi:hypothetical protein